MAVAILSNLFNEMKYIKKNQKMCPITIIFLPRLNINLVLEQNLLFLKESTLLLELNHAINGN